MSEQGELEVIYQESKMRWDSILCRRLSTSEFHVQVFSSFQSFPLLISLKNLSEWDADEITSGTTISAGLEPFGAGQEYVVELL